MDKLFRIIFLCLFATSTKGSSTGGNLLNFFHCSYIENFFNLALNSACEDMTPRHNNAAPQIGDVPATLSLSADTYKEDTSIEGRFK